METKKLSEKVLQIVHDNWLLEDRFVNLTIVEKIRDQIMAEFKATLRTSIENLWEDFQ